MLLPLLASFRHGPKLLVGANPQLRMHLLVRHDAGLQDVVEQEVVVHRVDDDGSNGRVSEF